ncbi:hypothetical protein NIES4074_37630 [Cylindrospermum sp. NIES-4074]|nr:hypothetical protein NIES4074_37630 [Cylindrospermum sp. NIES-4074]
MGSVKNLSITILSAGFMVLATAAQALSVTLSYDRSIGSPGSEPGQLYVPQGITVDDTTGNVYISDGGNDRVQVFDQNGNLQKIIGSKGEGPGQFREPADLKFNPLNGNLYVGDVFNSRINVFDSQGNYLKSFAKFGERVEGRSFFGPGGLSFDKSGNLYITDFSNDYIQVFDQNDNLIKTIGSNGNAPGQFVGPAGISVSPTSGNIFVADQYNNRIQVLDPEGNPLLAFGSPGTGLGEFQQPIGVEVDEYDNVYVADSINSRVQVFDKNGNFLSTYGVAAAATPPASDGPPVGNPLDLTPGTFNWTAGAHYDNGKLYVGDFFQGRIQVLNVEGRTEVPEPASALGLALLGMGVATVKLRKNRQQQTAINLD